MTQADKYVFVLGMNSDFVDSDRSLEFLQDKRITSYMICHDASRFIDRGFYFNALTEPVKGGIFVDCGAYRGDTLERFINWSGGRYKKIFAIEADKKNFAVLEKTVRDNSYKNVLLINCGLWSDKGTLSFNSFGDVETISVDTLDNIIGDEPIDFVKLMIQGSELNALQGATNIMEIQQQRSPKS